MIDHVMKQSSPMMIRSDHVEMTLGIQFSLAWEGIIEKDGSKIWLLKYTKWNVHIALNGWNKLGKYILSPNKS